MMDTEVLHPIIPDLIRDPQHPLQTYTSYRGFRVKHGMTVGKGVSDGS